MIPSAGKDVKQLSFILGESLNGTTILENCYMIKYIFIL